MSSFFFGPVAVCAWILASLIFCFCATWLWQIVREVGGLRGTALAVLFTALAIVCSCFGLILMKQQWIPAWILGAIVSSMFPPIVFAALVLSDLYSADRNGHRSFTTRSFQAYRNWVDSRKEKGIGTPFASNHSGD